MRLLDLFCCEGGAGEGYARAGFEAGDVLDEARALIGSVDHVNEVLADLDFLAQFDVIHASPPCQENSITRHSHSNSHPELIAPVREGLLRWGGPYVIENTPPYADLRSPLTLCGTMFDLTAEDTDGLPLFLRRHRWFESNVLLMAPGPCRCVEFKKRGFRCAGAYGGGSSDREHAQHVRRGGYTPAKEVRAELLGTPWMTLHGMSQSIPPAYTEWLGRQLLAVAEVAA